MTTGLTPTTFENLQLNAGVFLKDFVYDTATSADTLRTMISAAIKNRTGTLGATRGGGTFQCTPETRSIDADGMRYQFVGSTMIDSWDVRMTGTLLEITPENFKDALATADITKTGNLTTVRIRTAIQEEDYIPTLCWVGDTSKGFVLIEIYNALSTTGANFTFTDKGEGTLPFEFVAHQASLEDQEYAPCKIIFFDDPESEVGS